MSRIKWGSYLLPPAAAPEHFLFVGSTGSGKSVLIKMLMRSVLADTASESGTASPSGTRAVIYDAKQEIVPFLHDLVPAQRIQILHPFDKRGWAWDIAKDVTSLLAARQIATILVPESSQSTETEQFFIGAARELVLAAMIALMHSAKSKTWTLRDLLLLALDAGTLSQALAQCEIYTARRIRKQYLEEVDYRTKANIMTTLATKMSAYEPVAAAWHDTSQRLSIAEWSRSGNFLVLGNDERARSSLDPINRALFQRICEEVLSFEEQKRQDATAGRGRTWLILDEFREAGKLLGLRSLLNKGRSKGACVVLGCQDVEGVRAVYGPQEAGELLAQCLHTVVLNIGNPETAQWASNLFGSEDTPVESLSVSRAGPYHESDSEKLERKTLVTTRELLSMPRLNPQHGLSGYYKSPVLEHSPALQKVPQYQRICPWRFGQHDEFSWDKIAPALNVASGIASFESREQQDPYQDPYRYQYLREWTAREREVLHLEVPETGVPESADAESADAQNETAPNSVGRAILPDFS